MLRYCVNCKKEFDFDPLAVSGKADLICPECGGIIGKESRDPSAREKAEEIEEKIGEGYAGLLRLSYVFYMTVSIAALVSYVLGIDMLLYALTIVSLAVFIIQLLTGTLIFRSGIIFLPAGAVLGYMYFKDLQGACLGIHIVFLIRHVIRDILYTLLWKFIKVIR